MSGRSSVQFLAHGEAVFIVGIQELKKEPAMYLPKVYEKFTSRFPEVFKNFQQIGKTCRESGPLEKKYQDLANLGIAIGANSRGAVMSQTRKALESGASKEEIAHVVLLSLTTIGFPNMIAAMGWVDEVLEGS
jgi:4-carboxymuconolactone decarboxylase